MITLVDLLFILTPLLLISLVYFERKLNSVLLCKEPNALEKQFVYKLVYLINDIITLFTSGYVWMAITYIIVTNGKGDCFFLIMPLIMMSLVSCICTSFYYSTKLNSVQKNAVLLILIGTLSTLSKVLTVFFIATIMNYFFGLELYAFNI